MCVCGKSTNYLETLSSHKYVHILPSCVLCYEQPGITERILGYLYELLP